MLRYARPTGGHNPVLRERSLFTTGGGQNNFSAGKLRGAEFQCKLLEGGKISMQAFRGGQNFSAQKHVEKNDPPIGMKSKVLGKFLS